MYATKKGRRLAISLLVFLIAAGLAFHYVIKDPPDYEEVAKFTENFSHSSRWLGRTAPDFDLSLLSGETFALRDHIGKRVIVLNFFATWCPPCVAEMPELSRFHAAYAGDDFMLIGIDADEQPEVVAAFLDEYEVSFPVGIDYGKISRRFGAGKLPTTVLIGVDGRIQLYEVGAIANADVAFAELISSNIAARNAGGSVDIAEWGGQKIDL